jgi:hypothetical protein
MKRRKHVTLLSFESYTCATCGQSSCVKIRIGCEVAPAFSGQHRSTQTMSICKLRITSAFFWKLYIDKTKRDSIKKDLVPCGRIILSHRNHSYIPLICNSLVRNSHYNSEKITGLQEDNKHMQLAVMVTV